MIVYHEGLELLKPVQAEQVYLTTFYTALDRERERTESRRGDEQIAGTRNAQALHQRDGRIRDLNARLSRLNSAEEGLCFGRLDDESGEVLHIGRIGLHDEDYEPLLVDWRAPVARPFYIATAVANHGVVRRRHIQTRLRQVVDVQDEQLDLDRTADGASQPGGGVVGEAVLLNALEARRTGTMESRGRTIQADQDRIIRSVLAGVLVVQGGPGTGKTAIALHRAAFLLYTHRELLEKRGILVVGPNPTFLKFIGQVLPSLGEDGVRLVTVAELYPGLTATRPEPAEVSEVKGRAVMAEVIETAVADRQWVPAEPLELTVDRTVLRLDPSLFEDARARARARRLTHNQARRLIAGALVEGRCSPRRTCWSTCTATRTGWRRRLRNSVRWTANTCSGTATTGARPMSRCSTRRQSSSATTGATGPANARSEPGRSLTPKGPWTCCLARGRPTTTRTTRRRSSAPRTSSTRRPSPRGTRLGTIARWQSGPRSIAAGPTGT